MGLIEAADAAVAVAPTAPTEKTEGAPAVSEPEAAPNPQPTATSDPISSERRWVTPLVRAMMKEHGLGEADLAGVTGTGEGGRVTRRDIEVYLANGAKKSLPPAAPASISAPSAPTARPEAAPLGRDQELVPLVGIRKMIAEAMVRAAQIPAVSTVTQVDVTTMVKFRELNKESFASTYGVKLTYTPFFIKALAETLGEFPLVNASLRDDNQIVMSKGVHIGIAVALGKGGEGGLIVPVIRDCHRKTLVDIARDLDAIAQKARAGKLGMEDIKGGTFTLTNPGTYGALFGTPMINAPQGGILGAYAISKQPVIIDDMIAIRSIMHLVLTYDHRLIDGMLAGRFLAGVRDRLQAFDFFK
jgi:pyruvate/2-oxoglutarate dehydrogenase complex dihydrolipoamide acyltransferase (E2) component